MYVATIPHTLDAYFTQAAADSAVGQTVPFTVEGHPEMHTKAVVRAARVDERGLHLEMEVDCSHPAGEALWNLAVYGVPHPPDEVFPAAPEFSIGHNVGRAELDPLARISHVHGRGLLDSHESRDALREIARAAVRIFGEKPSGAPTDPAAHD